MNVKIPSGQSQKYVLSLMVAAVISAPAVAAKAETDSKSKSLDTQVVVGQGAKSVY